MGLWQGAQAASIPILLDDRGQQIDAHDGKIEYWDGTFFWYGTSYGCGFEWQRPEARFCGFKVYTSKDLRSWHDEGLLFDSQTLDWQSRCDGKTYGCFRPHVLKDPKRERYVLWINSYDVEVGYHVFVSSSPIGPFVEQPLPSLSTNREVGPGLNHGDHDLFLDEDGQGYIAYTDWRRGGDIVIEKLSPDLTTGTGVFVRLGTSRVEAPSLFRRGDRVYLLVSDPNCGYCVTGTSAYSAPHPLGPWRLEGKLSTTSGGGQPAAVTQVRTETEDYYLYQSDQWHNLYPYSGETITRNQSLASQFWTRLHWDSQGRIQSFRDDTGLISSPSARAQCDVGQGGTRGTQVLEFKVEEETEISAIEFLTFQLGRPRETLEARWVTLREDGTQNRLLGKRIFRPEEISWSAETHEVPVYARLQPGTRYALILESSTRSGCYGWVTENSKPRIKVRPRG